MCDEPKAVRSRDPGACDLLGVEEVVFVGSQALLGQHPDAPREPRMSAEVDVWVEGLLAADTERLNAIGIDSRRYAPPSTDLFLMAR